MAKKQTPTVQDYHKSETYKNADAETRRNLHRYKSELNITDEQMNWLMALEDVRLTPKEQRRKGNATAEMMVIGSTAGAWSRKGCPGAPPCLTTLLQKV